MKKLPFFFFQLGEFVAWTSQAAGYRKVKHGEIVRLVPAGVHPKDLLPVYGRYAQDRWGRQGQEFVCSDALVQKSGSARDHCSYLVRVRKTLYWPRVDGLRLVKADLNTLRAANGEANAAE